MFLKVIPGVFDRLLNFKMTWRFLLRRSMFLEYPFFSCHYDLTQSYVKDSIELHAHKTNFYW